MFNYLVLFNFKIKCVQKLNWSKINLLNIIITSLENLELVLYYFLKIMQLPFCINNVRFETSCGNRNKSKIKSKDTKMQTRNKIKERKSKS